MCFESYKSNLLQVWISVSDNGSEINRERIETWVNLQMEGTRARDLAAVL